MNATQRYPFLTRPLNGGPWYAVPLVVGIMLALLAIGAGIWAAVAWAIRAAVVLAFPGGTAANASMGTYSEALGAAVMLGIALFAPRKVGKRTNGVSRKSRFGIALWPRALFLLWGLFALVKAIDGFSGGH